MIVFLYYELILKKAYNSFHLSTSNQIANKPTCIAASREVHNRPFSNGGWLNKFLQNNFKWYQRFSENPLKS